MNRDVFFNELSIPTEQGLGYRELESLKDLYLALREISGIGFVCRLDSEHLADLVRGAMAQSNGRDVAGFLYAFLRPPFEGDSTEDDQVKYMQSEWKCGGRVCFGLAMGVRKEVVEVEVCGRDCQFP